MTSQRQRRLSMLIAATGTIVEWFDYSLFFYVSTALSETFYPGMSNSLVLVLATGAVGFLFRPLGAVVFGHIGDTRGRTVALVTSAGLMAIAMLGIALMPGYATIGIWGGIGVLALRALAGFSVGAEYTGIMVYLMESAAPKRRGFVASWASANSEVGALLAVGSAALVTALVGSEGLTEWGWRLPFFLGAVLAALMIPARRFMVESPAMAGIIPDAEPRVRPAGSPSRGVRADKCARPESSLSSEDADAPALPLEGASHEAVASATSDQRSPLVEALRSQPQAVITSFLISLVGSATYFLTITYLPTYVESVHGSNAQTALNFGIIAAVAAILATPFFGLASDRWGRRRACGATLLAVLALVIPGYAMLGSASASTLGLAAVLLAAPAAGWSAIAAAAVPEQFEARGRYSGMAVGYNVAAVIFGGLTPPIVTWLTQTTGEPLTPAYYATGLALLGGIPAILVLRDRVRRPEFLRRPAAEHTSARTYRAMRSDST